MSSPNPNGVFQLNDWDDYYLYPSEEGKLLISSNERVVAGSPVTPLREPYGGATTVIQASSASSAFIGIYSPIIPSIFAQTMSVNVAEWEAKNDGNDTNATVHPLAANSLYNADILYNLAICSQWPNLCEDSDFYFIDGGYQDATGLSASIGQYHSTPDANLDAMFKVILTNTNEAWDGYQKQLIMQHYSTTLNEKIEPGDFLWDPDLNKQPLRSFQIFLDYMDESILDALIEPIEGSNITTALLSGITIDNPAYRVLSGQKVEILLINTNTPIPTEIASPELIEAFKIPMGNMAVEIATNPVLFERVQAFLGTDNEVEEATKPKKDIESVNAGQTSSLGSLFQVGMLYITLIASGTVLCM